MYEQIETAQTLGSCFPSQFVPAQLLSLPLLLTLLTLFLLSFSSRCRL